MTFDKKSLRKNLRDLDYPALIRLRPFFTTEGLYGTIMVKHKEQIGTLLCCIENKYTACGIARITKEG